MAQFMMDILRNGFVTVLDRRRIAAPNDAEAIDEADRHFTLVSVDDPDIYGYRLRELRRRRSRVVREVTKENAGWDSNSRSAA